VDFWIVLDYFIVYEAYFLVGEFLVELLELQVLLYCYALFSAMLSIGLSVVLWSWSMMDMSESL
jgi:hypothetical protein